MGTRRHQIWDDKCRIRMSEANQRESLVQMAVSDDQTDNLSAKTVCGFSTWVTCVKNLRLNPVARR